MNYNEEILRNLSISDIKSAMEYCMDKMIQSDALYSEEVYEKYENRFNLLELTLRDKLDLIFK